MASQLKIDFQARQWPDQEKFPLNVDKERQVKPLIIEDMKASKNYKIITGFTSLSHVIDTFGGGYLAGHKKIRIVLGFEPEARKRKYYKKVNLHEEIRDYWLEKGISPLKGGAVIQVINLIDSGHLDFRFLDHLHAKIYIGEHHAILGSANFSVTGVTYKGKNTQKEANIRVANNEAHSEQQRQYEGIRQIAHNFWQDATNFNEEIRDLLKQLLEHVNWNEALARGIAELIEGKWLREYESLFKRLNALTLFPTQWTGLAKGFHILQNQGSLLIADPTGSGKTRLVNTIQMALIHWLWETGRQDRSVSMVVAPKIVQDNWKDEQLELPRNFNDPFSQGILSSQPDSKKRKQAVKMLKQANIVVIDEVHNYLRPRTRRSDTLTNHNAEFVLLSTATPINRKAEDLLRIIELLDIDNLNEDELKTYKDLRKRKKLVSDPDTLDKLRQYIWKFTLRRTKSEINEEHEKKADQVTDENNRVYKFPEPVYETYKTGETPKDQEIAEEIRNKAENLKGLVYLSQLKFPDWTLDTDEKQEKYVTSRLKMARNLAVYQVMEKLRSSRPALIEQINGSQAAIEQFAIDPKKLGKKDTGNYIGTIEGFKQKLPERDFEDRFLPDWLYKKEKYREACEEEISIYREIARLTGKMSESRETTKARELIDKLDKHSLVLAFDHSLITLAYLEKQIQALTEAVSVYVVTGEKQANKNKVMEKFKRGSEAKNAIALCTDTMAEGVNLQQASAVFLLDMPSVMRVAEQRIGRIDRLDSPHNKIYSYWPNDTKAFALKSDKNLVQTSRITEDIMGANIKLPEALEKEFLQKDYRDLPTFQAQDLISEHKNRQFEEKEWEGIKDAFSEVHRLKDDLLSEDDYQKLKNTRVSVRCKVSFVKDDHDWAFIVLRGTRHYAPKWFFLEKADEPEQKAHVAKEFGKICAKLRERLPNENSQEFHHEELDYFLQQLRANERDVLPNKKRRALEVAEVVLQRQKKEKNGFQNLIRDILAHFDFSADTGIVEDMTVDFERFAELWLELLSPRLKALKTKPGIKNRQLLSLQNLKHKKYFEGFTKEELTWLHDNIPLTEKLDYRVAACVVGVREK